MTAGVHATAARTQRNRRPAAAVEQAALPAPATPPKSFRRLQPVKETQQKQRLLWRDLILRYCRHHRIHVVPAGEADDFPLFHNAGINRECDLNDSGSFKVVLVAGPAGEGGALLLFHNAGINREWQLALSCPGWGSLGTDAACAVGWPGRCLAVLPSRQRCALLPSWALALESEGGFPRPAGFSRQ